MATEKNCFQRNFEEADTHVLQKNGGEARALLHAVYTLYSCVDTEAYYDALNALVQYHVDEELSGATVTSDSKDGGGESQSRKRLDVAALFTMGAGSGA